LEIEALGLEWNDETKKNNPWKGIKQYKYADYRTKKGEYVKPEDARTKRAVIWIYRESDPSWPNANTLTAEHKDPDSTEYRFYQPIHPVTKKLCPAPSRGWLWKNKRTEKGSLSFLEMLEVSLISFGVDEKKIPQVKRFLDNVTSDVAKSVITDFTDGEKELANLIGERGTFPNPKPTTIIQSLISLSAKNSGYILDFFAGSGTTAHSVFRINEVGDKKLSFILNELGGHMYKTIIPRIKKIAYTFDWKTGKPKDDKMNGLGVFFKYQRLEQYEEALENISFTVSKDTTQKALAFKEYIPKYFLEFETRDSQSLVNTEAMTDPWAYELKIWDGLTYDTRQAVDLVETFNYLIGLHMQKCITKEINSRKYQFIYGSTNGGKQVLVVWRSTRNWHAKDYEADRSALTEEMKAFPHDLLYINGQAHIEGYEPIEHIFKNKMVS
ncbi:MAG: DNA methyltransferase, partial [Desulfobacteraceae bacterium]|nr:DNA methyltransferase [Desulfobacteraceae bacterium]